MPEAIASQLSAGAGRLIDLRWPGSPIFRKNSINVPAQIYNRAGVSVDVANLQDLGNANFGWVADWVGRSGAFIGATAGAAPSGAQWVFQPMVVNAGLRALGTNPPNLAGLDQKGAYRVAMLASSIINTGALAANVDKGLELCCAGGATFDDGQLCRLGTPGIGFRFNALDRVEAVIRGVQAGPLQRVDLTPTNYFSTDWHYYELRVIGARGVTDAVAKWYIDGQQVFAQSWGPGNVMPETNAVGPVSGFKTFLPGNGGVGEGYLVEELDFHCSKDELNLL